MSSYNQMQEQCSRGTFGCRPLLGAKIRYILQLSQWPIGFKAKNSLQDDEYSSPTFASLLFMESSFGSLRFVVGSESMNLQTRNALMYSQRHGFVTLHEVQGNM